LTRSGGWRIVATGDAEPPRVFSDTEADGMQPPPEPSAQRRLRAPPEPHGSGPEPASGAAASSITELLLAWSAGDRTALDALLPIVYDELRRQARCALRREGAGHTLQPTALVHEAYLRLVCQERARWEGRTQFFVVAAQVMRRVLVDHARARRAAKRGGGARHLTLDAGADAPGARAAHAEPARAIDVLAVDEALTHLAALDPRKARLVELRYFAGLSIPEAAAALGVSQATVGREWTVARLWLRRELDR
jgi:RNA polymerase sigma factor (TIGR02999 family)